MRHDSVPTTLVMIPTTPTEDAGEKPTTISMDWGRREKIVIHHRLGTKGSSLPVKLHTLSRTVSIFKRKQESKPEACAPVADPNCSQESGSTVTAKKSLQSPHPIIRPSKRGILSENPGIEKRVKRRSGTQSTMPPPRSPLSREIKFNPVDNPSSSATCLPSLPTIENLRPDKSRPSQYAAEYEKCGCTSGGRPPCQRCKLMLLSDRFCDLVNIHCAKWNL